MEVAVAQQELVVDGESNGEEEFERLAELVGDWPEDNVFQSARISSNRVSEAGERYHDAMANMVSRAPSLLDHLLEQWGLVELEDHERSFGEYVISHLDRNGRLPMPLEEIVQVYGRPIPESVSLEVLARIQPFAFNARGVIELTHPAFRLHGLQPHDGQGRGVGRERLQLPEDAKIRQAGPAAE